MRRLLSKFMAVTAVVAGLALGTASVPAVAQGVSPTISATSAQVTAHLDLPDATPDDWWF